MSNQFATQTKFCAACNDYCSYLASPTKSYCIQCGGEMRLMSDTDWQRLQATLEARKPKRGRKRKTASKASA